MGTTNNSEQKKLERVKMRGLKTPVFLVSFTGWIHSRRKKVIRNEKGISSNWLERKQKDFNEYCAVMLKETGRILLPLRKELAVLQILTDEKGIKLTDEKKRSLNMQPQSIEEKRAEAAAKKEIQSLKESYQEDKEDMEELKLVIEELEHESFQLLQKTREHAESKMLAYLHGANVIMSQCTLLDEAVKESELYKIYCKKEENLEEREVGEHV